MKILFVHGPRTETFNPDKALRFVEGLLRDAKIDASIDRRTHDDLGSFLYQKDSEFTNPESAKRFDKLDIVFLEGDSRASMPWLLSMLQVRATRSFDPTLC
jgi:hypothetical protein